MMIESVESLVGTWYVTLNLYSGSTMRLSHKHKFIFVAVPKTGSSSVRITLDCVSDVSSDPHGKESKYHENYDPRFRGSISDGHIKLREIKNIFTELGWEFEKYRILLYTRNPWDREVSNFLYKKKFIDDYDKGFELNTNFYEECHTILDDCEYDFNKYIDNENMLDPQYEWLYGDNLEQLAHARQLYIGKLPNMQYKFDQFLHDCMLPAIQLPHINKTDKNRPPYQDFYNKRTKEIVAEHYERDNFHFGWRWDI